MLAGMALLGASGCSRQADSGVTRLVDRFKREMIKGSPGKRSAPEPAALWSFGAPAAKSSPEKAALGWSAGDGVTGLSHRDGRLKGHTTTNFPILYVERQGKLDTPDLLYAIEVRLRVSKGTNVMATTQGQVPLDIKDVLERAKGLQQPWPFASPVLASDDLQTIVLRNAGVGSEVARLHAGHRPPLKLYVQFSRIQLSRRLTLPRCKRRN